MGKPLFEGTLRYCVRCVLPETAEGIRFDDRGICNACNSSEEKMHIDWEARARDLRVLLDRFKEAGRDRAYDCILPISGGKDSFFQTHVLVKVYGMRPLAVTFNHNWYTEVGKRNLSRLLEVFDVDHMMYTPKRSLVNRMAGRAVGLIGDPCWHCHAGIGSYVLHVATKFNIPFIVWGESVAEEGMRGSYYDSTKRDVFDEEYFVKISAKKNVDHMAGGSVERRELEMFDHPSAEDYRRIGIKGIHLGDYMFWDEERQTEYIKETYGWEEAHVEGAYKQYKSVECKMAGLHDYTKFIKRGYGRATDHAARDVRAGIMTREEGFDIIAEVDPVPPGVLKDFQEFTGMTLEDIKEEVKQHRPDAAKPLP